MNWSRTLIAGVVAGVALNITEFIFHALIMSSTYARYPEVFSQDESGMLYFLLNAVCVSIAAAILFSKSRASWADGIKGGATFGAALGLVLFFTFFYNPLVYEGYPYYLAWCQGSITLIAMVVVGSVLGVMIKR